MSEQTPTGKGATPPAITVSEAAKAFELMMAPPPEDKPDGDEVQPGAEAQAEAGEQPDVEAGEEATGSEDEESGEEAAESEEQSEGDEDQEEKPSAEPKFTVRVDGKDEEVSQSELIAGYSRTSDYTRKTQALSNERKAFVADQETVRAERAEYATLLPKLRAALAGTEQEPNWSELREKDPQAYLMQRDAWDQRQRTISAIAEQERKTAERSAKDHEAQVEQIRIEQHNLLMKALPSWRDRKVAEAETGRIVETLQSAGYSGAELEIFDHRAILIARKAALYDEMQAKREKVAPKLKQAPVIKPGAAQRKPTNQQRVAADMNRLKKSGRVDDAASVFKHFL